MNDGGPAFPISSSTGDPRDGVYCRDGMTLRDWFAGMALSGELASTSTHASAGAIARASVKAGLTVEAHIARTCYKMADAMLAERSKQP